MKEKEKRSRIRTPPNCTRMYTLNCVEEYFINFIFVRSIFAFDNNNVCFSYYIIEMRD